MKFLITMTDADGAWDALGSAEQDRIMKQHEEFRAALEAEGRFVSQCQLFPRRHAGSRPEPALLHRDERLRRRALSPGQAALRFTALR